MLVHAIRFCASVEPDILERSGWLISSGGVHLFQGWLRCREIVGPDGLPRRARDLYCALADRNDVRAFLLPSWDNPALRDHFPRAMLLARRLGPLSEVRHRMLRARIVSPLVSPRISLAEFGHLTFAEQSIARPATRPKPLARRVQDGVFGSPAMPLSEDAATPVTGYILGPSRREAPVLDDRLPPLFAGAVLHSAGPGQGVRLPLLPDAAMQSVVSGYCEIDITARFDSPNLVVYPPLYYRHPRDAFIADRQDYALTLTVTRQRRWDGLGGDLAAPVPIELLCLPRSRTELRWGHLAALGIRMRDLGGSSETRAQRVQDYCRLAIWFGKLPRGSQPHSLDVMRIGVGGCGHMNGLAALLLEFSGVRTRGVSGFTPSLRGKGADNGHSVLEYWDAERDRWRLLDCFYDLHLPIAAAELRDSPFGATIINHFKPARRNLATLFSFRRYYDKLGRMPVMTCLDLGAEDSYGADWDMCDPEEMIGDVGETRRMPERLFVRSRYLVGDDIRMVYCASAETFEHGVKLARDRRPLEQIASVSPWQTEEIQLS